jgi:hypothetical protein|tara:strand:- start:1429 stop:1545 length:117 start_codon:yes stop_codon:yes gene_type:complete
MARSSKTPSPSKRVKILNEWIKANGFDKKRRKPKKEDE